jgi:hypothetical protein
VPDYIAGAHCRFSLNALARLYFTPNVTWRHREVIGSELDILARLEYADEFEANVGCRDDYGPTIGVGV